MGAESEHSILILDDCPAFQKVAKKWLSEAGYKVTVTSETVASFNLARNEQFDLVISDYYLPDYLGTDFVQRLRDLENYKHVPIIMVTGRADELNVERLRSELQVLVLPKPCDMQGLCETVAQCLSLANCAN